MLDFEIFLNNVICRNDSNQHKARKIWKEIKHTFTDKQILYFEIEWNHYLLNEFDSTVFSKYIQKLKKEYKNDNN